MTTAPGTDQLNAILTQQLTDRAAEDPMAALLLAQLQTQGQGPTGAGRDPLTDLERRLDAALHANEQLRVAVAAGDEMCRWVARVVGACPACWGLRIQCPECRGLGRPGSLPADVDALLEWLGPTLRRHGLTVTTTGGRGGRRAGPPTVTEPHPTTTTAREQEVR